MFRKLSQPAHDLLSAADRHLDSIHFFKSLQHILRQKLVKVVSSQQGISADGKIPDVQDAFLRIPDTVQGYVQRSPSKIKHHHVLFRVKGEEIRRNLAVLLHTHKVIDDGLRLVKKNIMHIFHIDSGLCGRVESRLALVGIERRRHCDDHIPQFLLKQTLFR